MRFSFFSFTISLPVPFSFFCNIPSVIQISLNYFEFLISWFLWDSSPQCKGRNLTPLIKTTINSNKWPDEWVLSSNHHQSRCFQNRSPIRSDTSHMDSPKGKHFRTPNPCTHRRPGRQLFKAYSVSSKTRTLQRTSASQGCADAFPPTAGANQGNYVHTVILPFSEVVEDTLIKQEVPWWLRW